MNWQNKVGLGMLMSTAIGILGISTAQAQVTFNTDPSGTINDSPNKYSDAASVTFSENTPNVLTITLVNTSLSISGSGTFQEDIGNTMYGLYFTVAGQSLTSFFSSMTGVAATGDTEYTVPSKGTVDASSPITSPYSLDWQLQSSGLTGLVGGNKEGLVAGNFTLPPGNSLSNNDGHSPYFTEEMIFTLDYSGTLDLSTIGNVEFEYGTTGNVTVNGVPVPPPTAVPEASTIVAGALMLLPLGIAAFRSLRKERSVNLS